MTTRILSVCAALLVAPAAFAQTPAPAPAAVVSAETVDATLRASIANNTLDKKMNETPVKGGIVRIGIVHRTKPEPRALLHDSPAVLAELPVVHVALDHGEAVHVARGHEALVGPDLDAFDWGPAT